MQRITIDTNVFVSALLSPGGTPARILDFVLNSKLQICYDSRVIAEYESVLLRPKFGFSKRDIKTLLDFLTITGFSVIPEPLDIPMPDESDRKFYELCKHCGTYLVTGNTKHYSADEMVVTPSQFIKMI